VASFILRVPVCPVKRNVNILVSLRTCKFHFYKPGEESQRQFEHHQLLQLVKSRSKDTRLTVVLEGQGKKDYIFSDMRVCIVILGPRGVYSIHIYVCVCMYILAFMKGGCYAEFWWVGLTS